MKIPFIPALTAALFTTAAPLLAGTYVKNYTGMPDAQTGYLFKADGTFPGSAQNNDGSYLGSNNAVASIRGERVRLTSNSTANSSAIYRLPNLDPGLEVASFHVEFDMALFSSNAAEGVSFNFGGLPPSDANGPGEEGYQLPGGMVISFDTRITATTGETARTLDVRIDGNQLVSVNESAFGNYKFDGTNVHVVINWDAGGLDVTYGAYAVCNNLPVPGLIPESGDRFAFSGRTSTQFEDVFLDNLNVSTTPQTAIVRPNLAISEMVIDNTKHEDEHCQTPGWMEIYNGTASAVSLNGWSLTDDAAVPAKWPFPAGQSIAPYGYLVVYFGHPETTINPDTRLHTTFVPAKAGGYLGLFQGTTEIDAFAPYPAQAEDVSYGHMGHPWTLGFIEIPNPGSKNVGLQEAGPPVDEEVAWSRDGGLITGPISLTLAAPVVAGGQIRYSLDNARPHPGSILYDHTTPATIDITARANVRARIFAPGRLPGPVTSRTFLKIDSSITNYRGTGQPFNSNLPIILIDSFGRGLDQENSATPGARPFRYTYNVVLDRDPANSNRTFVRETKHDNLSDAAAGNTRAPVNVQSRSGMHVRGESSSGMPQRQYAWETNDNEGGDKPVSILGMPAESDWILYAPATDKTLMRNFIAYSSMMDTNGEGSAMRVKFVEVFFNQPPLGGISEDPSPDITWRDYRGVYVLVERIKRGNARVDIQRLRPCDTDPSLISGGYIFKKDKASVDPDFSTTGGQLLQIVEPTVAVGDPQWTWLRNHVNAFEAALNGPNYADPALGYRAYIEEQTFMDGQWWVEVFKQIDGYRLSHYFTKDRGQKIKSAPIWDWNLSIGNADYLDGWKYRGWYHALVSGGDYQFFARLRTDQHYTMRHWDRYWKLRRTVFATPAILGRIDAAVAELTDSQTTVSSKNSLNWDIANYNAASNSSQRWPNSVPSAENPAARHHARWQRLGVYDWPNAAGRDTRDYFVSSTDAADFATATNTPYNPDSPPPMSEAVHARAYTKLRLDWIDDGYLAGTTILRPPVFSQEGGNVSPGYQLTISSYTGTPPPASNYGVAGTLSYATGTVYYTIDGADPGAPPQVVQVKEFVSDTQPVHATVPSSAAADTDSFGKSWKDWDFDHLSPPSGVTWYAGTNGVGYDDTRAPAVDFMPVINIQWGTAINPVASKPTMRNVNQTSYIRLPFNLTAADISGITRLRLLAKFDDGIIAWVNGVKIGEKNPPAGTPQWNSGTTTIHDDMAALSYEEISSQNIAPALAALRVGANVLAVHGLNSGLNSADFLQRIKLEGITETVNRLTYTGPITITSPVTIRARTLDNVTGRWTPMTEGTFVINTDPASAANLVVTEIMYNPTAPTAAEIAAGFNNDNMFEYLEFQNIGPNTIDLAGVEFTTGFSFTWPSNDPNLRLLAPGERALIVGHAAAFAMRYNPGPGVKIVGVYDGNLGNGGEHLVISGTLGTIKDFTYEDDAPWPLEADGLGYSLVLNHPGSNPDHNLAINWRAGFEPGGTPGAAAGASGPTGSAAAALADTDGDGLSDLLEYVSGTLGVVNAPQQWPSTGMLTDVIIPPSTTPDDYLTFSYVRSRSADGFTYDPEVSTALGVWSPLSTLFTLHSQENNADGTATIRWRSTQPASDLGARLFLRVRAGITP